MQIATYDPDDPTNTNGTTMTKLYNSTAHPSRSLYAGRVSTISQNYTEKTMLLSSDDEN